jgi:hypothetical protein
MHFPRPALHVAAHNGYFVALTPLPGILIPSPASTAPGFPLSREKGFDLFDGRSFDRSGQVVYDEVST